MNEFYFCCYKVVSITKQKINRNIKKNYVRASCNITALIDARLDSL